MGMRFGGKVRDQKPPTEEATQVPQGPIVENAGIQPPIKINQTEGSQLPTQETPTGESKG